MMQASDPLPALPSPPSKKWADEANEEISSATDEQEGPNDDAQFSAMQNRIRNKIETGESSPNIDAKPVPMLKIEPNLAPFLVGVKGRNISLIRKFTGMLISIEDSMVYMRPSRPRHLNPDLAWKLVLSACYGGILRWFETPYATKKGYPAHRAEDLQSLARTFNCTLDLLRSRRGHMCLLLVPNLSIPAQGLPPSEAEIHANMLRIQNARQELMQALSVPRQILQDAAADDNASS